MSPNNQERGRCFSASVKSPKLLWQTARCKRFVILPSKTGTLRVRLISELAADIKNPGSTIGRTRAPEHGNSVKNG